jgi:excisionase family DNA binding protein
VASRLLSPSKIHKQEVTMKFTITVEVDDSDLAELADLLPLMQTGAAPDGSDGPPSLLTILEAAQALRVGRCTVQELVLSGALQSIRIGSRRLIPHEAIGTYVATRLDVPEERRAVARR